MMGHLSEEDWGGFGAKELECKICYCPYSHSGQRPKVLQCCHRLCAKCLVKILDLGESPPNAVICPFCRYVTRLSGEALASLQDNYNLVTALSHHALYYPNIHENQQGEILLSTRHLSSLVGYSASASPSSTRTSYVVITFMDPPQEATADTSQARGNYRSSSLDSMTSVTRQWTVKNCAALFCQTSAQVLLWLFGLLYFSSLPLGVYLLIMQKTMAGLLLVSFVPISLLMIMGYGLCQCMYHEFWNCVQQ